MCAQVQTLMPCQALTAHATSLDIPPLPAWASDGQTDSAACSESHTESLSPRCPSLGSPGTSGFHFLVLSPSIWLRGALNGNESIRTPLAMSALREHPGGHFTEEEIQEKS